MRDARRLDLPLPTDPTTIISVPGFNEIPMSYIETSDGSTTIYSNVHSFTSPEYQLTPTRNSEAGCAAQSQSRLAYTERQIEIKPTNICLYVEDLT